MPGVFILNPAMVDGYGNKASITTDGDGINRLYTSTTTEGQSNTELFDAAGNPITIIDYLGTVQLSVSDQEQISLLEIISVELKKIRFHLSLMTEHDVYNNEEDD